MTILSKIDVQSPDSYPDGLDLFSTPFTKVGIEKCYEKEMIPLNPVGDPPFTFRINLGASVVDLSQTRIVTTWGMSKQGDAYEEEVKVPDPAHPNDDTKATTKKIKREGRWEPIVHDAANPKNSDPIDVVNGLGAVFPSNVIISVNGQQVYNANRMYAYHANFCNELQYDIAAKKGAMSQFGYYYEEELGASAPKRRRLFADGNEPEFSAPIYADILNQTRYFLSNTELEIQIYPHHKDFLLVHNYRNDVKLAINHIRLYMTFVDLLPGTALDLERKLEKDPARYPYRRSENKSIFMEKGRQESNNTLFTDQVPHNLVVAFVRKDNYVGKHNLNPFEFIHGDLEDLRVQAGNLQVPFTPWRLNWKKGQFARAYDHFQRTLGNVDTGITREMFEKGWSIFPFILTTSQQDEGGFSYIRDGQTNIYARFAKDIVDGGINMVVVGNFDSLMFIDKLRTVRTDLTV